MITLMTLKESASADFFLEARLGPPLKSLPMTKVLMVCLGNICRSPMAASVARQIVRDQGYGGRFEFDAAGTHAQHHGETIDARARSVLAHHGYAVDKRLARRVNAHDFACFDLILAMDQDNLRALQQQCPPEYLDKLHLLLAFAPETGRREVPDPYYGNVAGFERVLALCEAGVRGLIRATLAHTL